MDRIAARIERARPLAIVGAPPPRLPAGRAELRIACDSPGGPLGPLRAARRRADDLLGTRLPLLDLATDRVRAGLRRTLLGEATPEDDPDGLLEAFNHLADTTAAVLVLDAIDAADPATLDLLGRWIRTPGRLRLPLILVARRNDGGAAADLLDALRRVEGHDAVITADDQPTRAALPPLPDAVRRVLRAGALAGDAFDAATVGALLDQAPEAVLDALQVAADAGVALEDDGEARFRLNPADREAPLVGLLPSLARAWNLRLARLLAPAEARPAAPAPAPDPPPDAGRAAQHLAEAGAWPQAIDHLLAAAGEAATVGAPTQAVRYVRQAIDALDNLPHSGVRRHKRVELLAELARYQAASVGPGRDFTLEGALETIEQAQALLQPGDDAGLAARVAQGYAHVLFDIGTTEALDRALALLTDAARGLEAAGQPVEAARLFNDQAAVWVRLGDPVRAHGLLEASRQVFHAQAAEDDEARFELAETDHLIARLPLHAEARPGRAADAVRVGLEHATRAAEAYAELGLERERARAWETMGRLELLRRAPDDALTWFERALGVQQQAGDVLGLAASVEGAARALCELGRYDEALSLLGDSLTLNVRKGSRRGVALLQRTLDGLVSAMPVATREQLAPAIDALAGRLLSDRG
jgi:tetratricopeptide (TPR) repeat protein